MNLINAQLAAQGLEIKEAQAAVIDAPLIQSAGAVRKKAIEIDGQGEISTSAASKDEDAGWVKKGATFILDYKQHTRIDEEGYIEKLHITAANAHEGKHLVPLLAGVKANATVYANKGYDSKANQEQLQARRLIDGIMRKGKRGIPSEQAERARNKALSKNRYVVEQTFGTLHRKFCHKRARYFGLVKVAAQSHLKAICVNLLKAGNRIKMAFSA